MTILETYYCQSDGSWKSWLRSDVLPGTPEVPTPGVVDPYLLCTLPTGTYPNGELMNESSGIVDSRRHANTFWTHEDSAAQVPPNHYLYVFSYDGTLRKIFDLNGTNIFQGQWEDLAYHESTNTIWVANCGNNNLNRPTFTVYKFPEPTTIDSDPNTVVGLDHTGVYEFQWGDALTGGWNCETMLVSPAGRLYFVNKAPAADTGLYAAPTTLVPYGSGVNTLTKVATWNQKALITAGDWASNNSYIATTNGNDPTVWLYNPTTFAFIETRTAPVPVNNKGTSQSESLGFTKDSKALLRGTEGQGSEVWFMPVTTSTLPLVPTISSKKVFESYSVNAHPTHGSDVYNNITAWMERMVSMGCYVFRGRYDRNNANMTLAINECRRLGVKWIMTVMPENLSSWSVADTTAQVNDIATDAADICLAIEGRNEPNNASDLNWATDTVAQQKAIWDTVQSRTELAHVHVIGPSLHDVWAAQSDGQDYVELADAGVLNYQDYAGLHRYPGGQIPTYDLQRRLDYVYAAYGADYPIWITETGYHNALATGSTHKPASESASATYAARALFQFADRDIQVSRYELLDDPDPAPKDDSESNFGLWRVESTSPTTWVEKPEVAKLRSVLTALKDDGTDYTPSSIPLEVTGGTADLFWCVTRKRNGTARIWLCRDLSVWDPVAKTATTVGSISVTVTDSQGPRTINVDGEITSMDLR